ncbi:uncharacterized protein LOC127082537 [Lathyrus oleraceus]|uniref:uncharacterized protein LOC127082537 n=1 Tax=Pisum sativum TaxID=3888 RepID=UPI0021D2944D|nr:uncharacterized protein LOC127082537 [Pisum sativum]
MKVLDKGYSLADHVNKIIRSFPKKWRPMVTALKLEKDLNNISIEELVSSLRSHEIEFEEDEIQKRGKYVALKSKPEKTKAYQAEEESEGSDEESQHTLISKRVNKLWKHMHNGQGKFRGAIRTVGHFDSSSGKKKQDYRKEVICSECKEPGHYKNDCRKLKKDRRPTKNFSKGKKGLMATWDDSESKEEDSDKEKANAALMATTNDLKGSEEPEDKVLSESESDSDSEEVNVPDDEEEEVEILVDSMVNADEEEEPLPASHVYYPP